LPVGSRTTAFTSVANDSATLTWTAPGSQEERLEEGDQVELDGDTVSVPGYRSNTTGVAVIPPLLTRDVTTMASWVVLLLAAVPLVGRSLDVFTQVATYLAVAALALLVAVEIEVFSPAEMTPSFAVSLVVITTMAIAGVWAIARYFSDQFLATSFLSDQTALMWDLVLAAAVGLGAGLLFELYFRRYSHAGDRFEDGGDPL
jgi:hypothetical protein